MNDSVVCSTSEIRIAYNNIERYADFLNRSIEEYIRILSYVQNVGIEDNQISAALSEMAEELTPRIRELEKIIDRELKLVANREISEIEAADQFLYPDELLAQISSILAMFLG